MQMGSRDVKESTVSQTPAVYDCAHIKSMSLEFGSMPCPLKCSYCYGNGSYHQPLSFRKPQIPLSVDEILGVLDQARELGLSGVGIIGPHEPIREPELMLLVKGIRAKGLRVTIFTKGAYFNESLARELCCYDVTLGITVHSLRPSIHDCLSGVVGTHAKMMRGLRLLLKAGYNKKPGKLLIQSVIVRQNLSDLMDVWRWARKNKFTPFFERLTIQGRARECARELIVAPEILEDLFTNIAEIDEKEYGHKWTPHPPWVGMNCQRHRDSCHMTHDGYIQPCTGVDIPVGNVRDADLARILRNSTIIKNLRNIRETIKRACKNCTLRMDCYGCRGHAYQLTGDYLAEDPCCWENPAVHNVKLMTAGPCSVSDDSHPNVHNGNLSPM